MAEAGPPTSGCQVRHARKLLRWSTATIAGKTGLPPAVVAAAQQDDGFARLEPSDRATLAQLFAEAGVAFFEERGGEAGRAAEPPDRRAERLRIEIEWAEATAHRNRLQRALRKASRTRPSGDSAEATRILARHYEEAKQRAKMLATRFYALAAPDPSGVAIGVYRTDDDDTTRYARDRRPESLPASPATGAQLA